MSQDRYDTLVKGVKEFQEIITEQAPSLGAVVNKQIELLQKELEGTSYGIKIESSLRTMKLEEAIREFIRQYKPQLINMAAQHNPYMERGALSQFVHKPVFFRILKEEKDVFFDFEETYKKTMRKFEEALAKLRPGAILMPDGMVDVVKSNYHLFKGSPTGGRRPKHLIPVKNIFTPHLDENYYVYKKKPYAFIRMEAFGLVGVLNLATADLYLHVIQTGRMSPKWVRYQYPRHNAWALRRDVVSEALARAYRNNKNTPKAKREVASTVTVDNNTPQQRRTTAVDAIRKKIVPISTTSVFDPKKYRVDILVPVTEKGAYCDIDSPHTSRLMFYEITSAVDENHAEISRSLFREILPYALVVNPGEAFPLRDFLKRYRNRSVVRWMTEHLRPSIR